MASHAHHDHHEETLVGITRDPALRPVGITMVVVGALWSLFIGMAAEAGSYKQPLAAIALVLLGVIVAGLGKPAEQI